jgi:hypothetical protein
MRTAALAAAAANARLVESCVELDDVLDDVGISAGAAASRLNDLRDASAQAAGADSRLAGELNDLRDALAENTAATQALSGRVNDLRDSFAQAALAAAALGKASDGSAARAVIAGSNFRLLGTGIRLTATAIHWLIAGTAEFLAVFVPATVAVGAWAFAWTQGAQNVYQHMTSLFAATESLGQAAGKTMGEMLGLNGAWQKIQNEANTDVYQVLGAGLNILSEAFGNLARAGLRAGQIFDTFAAKLVYDFSAAGGAGQRLGGLMANMVPDLVEIGQVFGNLGHALVNFASDMPGLAEGLLAFADAVSRVIYWISTLPKYLIMGFMALEEFNRWGSLAVTVMGKLGLATTELSGKTGSYFLVGDRFIGILKNMIGIIPNLAFGIASLASKIPLLGAAIGVSADDIEKARLATVAWIEDLSALETLGIAAVIAGLGFLVYKIVTTRSAAQQLGESMQEAASKANDLSVLRVVGANLADLSAKIRSAADSVSRYQQGEILAAKASQMMADSASAGAGRIAEYQQGAELAARAFRMMGDSASLASSGFAMARSNLAALSADQVQQVGDAARVVQGAEQIARAYHMTVPEAMATAQNAGVSLTNALKNQKNQWTQAGDQIRDYIRGLGAMGQSTGQVGHDMLAMAIQTGLAGTKIQQVNEAWDEFMQNLTGGTGGLAGLETAIEQIGSVVGKVSNNLSNSTGSMSLSTQQFAESLKHYTGVGASAWQNFTQIMGSTMPQLADWFRTAETEGAITGPRFTKAILDMSSQMTGFARDSKPAQAELVGFAQSQGLNIRTFPELEKAIKSAGANVQNLGKLTGDTTIAMSDMSKIAQNLGDVMNSQVTAAISNAALHTEHFYADVQNLTSAMSKYGAGSPQAVAAANKVTQAFDAAQKMAAEVGRNALQSQRDIDSMHGKNILIGIDENYYTTGTGGTIGGGGSGTTRHIVESQGAFAGATVHVHGSVMTEQGVTRALQASGLRQTRRNGSTQAYVPGRLH